MAEHTDGQWNEVTKEEFYATVGQLNVHPHPVGPFPYTSFWRTPFGTELGKVVDSASEPSKYYVSESIKANGERVE